MKCPHCGKVYKYTYTKHERTCRYNPEIVAMLKEILPSKTNPRRICTETEYLMARAEKCPNAPSRETIRKQFGCWENVAREFGLEVVGDNDVRIEQKQAATKAELQRLSEVLYGGVYAPTQNDYRKNAENAGGHSGPMTCDVLSHKYGSWDGVLEHFGISVPFEPQTARAVTPESHTTKTESYITTPYWYTTDNRVVDHDGKELLCVLKNRYRS